MTPQADDGCQQSHWLGLGLQLERQPGPQADDKHLRGPQGGVLQGRGAWTVLEHKFDFSAFLEETTKKHIFVVRVPRTPEELQEIVRSGIRTIRLPVTWAAFADALAPLSPSVYAAHNPDIEPGRTNGLEPAQQG